MKHAYHFCALHSTTPGVLSYNDGIARLVERVETYGGYRKLKESIVSQLGIPVAPDSIIVQSLSYLGEVED